jgi:hypothetical protein
VLNTCSGLPNQQTKPKSSHTTRFWKKSEHFSDVDIE